MTQHASLRPNRTGCLRTNCGTQELEDIERAAGHGSGAPEPQTARGSLGRGAPSPTPASPYEYPQRRRYRRQTARRALRAPVAHRLEPATLQPLGRISQLCSPLQRWQALRLPAVQDDGRQGAGGKAWGGRAEHRSLGGGAQEAGEGKRPPRVAADDPELRQLDWCARSLSCSLVLSSASLGLSTRDAQVQPGPDGSGRDRARVDAALEQTRPGGSPVGKSEAR